MALRLSSAISADGRFVAFSSEASDLVANDTNGTTGDVFVRDLQLGTTTLVSINRFGTGSGNGSSGWLSAISADGRFVAFSSLASDLVANDTNGTDDVFVRDLQLGTTTLVSINRFGTGSGNNSSFVPRSARTAVSWHSAAMRAIWWPTIPTVLPTTCSCGICSWGRLRW